MFLVIIGLVLTGLGLAGSVVGLAQWPFQGPESPRTRKEEDIDRQRGMSLLGWSLVILVIGLVLLFLGYVALK